MFVKWIDNVLAENYQSILIYLFMYAFVCLFIYLLYFLTVCYLNFKFFIQFCVKFSLFKKWDEKEIKILAGINSGSFVTLEMKGEVKGIALWDIASVVYCIF